MNDQDLSPLAAAGAAFAAWIPEEDLPYSFLLLEKNQRWDGARAEGKTWLAANDTEALKLLLPRVLDGPQSACLFANLASVVLRDEDRDKSRLLDEISNLLRIYVSDAREMRRSIEMLCAHDAISDDDQWQICCAALISLSAVDGEESEAESRYIKLFAPSASIIDAGTKQFDELKAEGIIEKVYRLNSRQKRFLAANLFAMMFVDGKWSGREQEMLDEFANKLFISRSELEKLLKASYTMFNLSVFD